MTGKKESVAALVRQLSSRVLGQSAALEVVGTWGSCWLAGVLEMAPRLLLLGPSGVGKTECALALSEALTSGEPVRLDMSEFQLPNSGTLLLGDRAGDQGRLRRALPSSARRVLLLDEIEKAHLNIHDLLLQMLEPGHVTSADGTRVDLIDIPIVCTSNLATAAIAEVQSLSSRAIEEHVLAQVRKHLRTEILNRFDALVVFQPLEVGAQKAIVRYQMDCYLQWLAQQGYQVVASDEVDRFLLLRGFDRTWGARPLRRAIRYQVGRAIVAALTRGESGSGTLQVADTRLEISMSAG